MALTKDTIYLFDGDEEGRLNVKRVDRILDNGLVVHFTNHRNVIDPSSKEGAKELQEFSDKVVGSLAIQQEVNQQKSDAAKAAVDAELVTEKKERTASDKQCVEHEKMIARQNIVIQEQAQQIAALTAEKEAHV